MNILNIGNDTAICNPASDVRPRIIDYGKFVDEVYVHVALRQKDAVDEEQIASNVWICKVSSRNRAVRWIKSFFVCIKIIIRKKIDVIISPDPYAKGVLSLLFSKILRKKFLLCVYGSNIFDGHWQKLSVWNKLYSFIGRIVFYGADAIQTDGLETFDRLRSKYGEKVFYKPLVPQNIDLFFNISREKALKDSVEILYVGRLIEQKNIPLLVSTVETVVMNRPDQVRCTIIGNGPMRDHIQKSFKKYIDNGTVTLIEEVSRSEMVEYFAKADIFLLTSYFEGFARVLMEAAASGVPIVTTRVSGVKNVIIENETGIVIEQGDVEGLANAVLKLIDDEPLRNAYGTRAREHCQSVVNYDDMLEKQKIVFEYLEDK